MKVVSLVREMGFQDVAFLPSRASFRQHFLEVMVKVMISGLTHALKMWLGVGKGMLPVKYFCSSRLLFVSV